MSDRPRHRTLVARIKMGLFTVMFRHIKQFSNLGKSKIMFRKCGFRFL